MKRRLSVVAAALLIFGLTSPAVMASATSGASFQMTIVNNGTIFSTPYGIAESDGSTVTTYVPIYYVNQVLSDLDFQVSWNGAANTWSITTSLTGLDFSSVPKGQGNTSIIVNNAQVSKVNTVAQLDPANGEMTTYVPIYYLTAILKVLGITANWDGATHVWSLTSESAANGLSTTSTSNSTSISSSGGLVSGSTGSVPASGTPSPSLSAPTIALEQNNASTNIAVTGAIGGAVLTLYENTGGEVVSTSANASGMATFYHVGAGTYYVVESSDGQVSGDSNQITVSASAMSYVPTISSGSSNGYFYIIAVNAAPNASATLYNTNGNLISTATTNQYGFAVFDAVSAGSYYVVVSADGNNLQSNAITVDAPSASGTTSATANTTSTTTLSIPSIAVADNSGTYSLTVSNVEPDATVTIYNSSGTTFATLIASASGTVTLENLNSGTYYAVQSWNGEKSAASEEVTVSAPLPKPSVSINMVNGYGDITVTGAISGATVDLYNSNGTLYATAQANASGYAAFNEVSTGAYYILQTYDGQQSVTVDLAIS